MTAPTGAPLPGSPLPVATDGILFAAEPQSGNVNDSSPTLLDTTWEPAMYMLQGKGARWTAFSSLITLAYLQKYISYANMWWGTQANTNYAAPEEDQFFRHHEQDFLIYGDPAAVTAQPQNSACVWYWSPWLPSGDTASPVQGSTIAGYKIYSATTDNALNGGAVITGTSYTQSSLTNGNLKGAYVDAVVVNGINNPDDIGVGDNTQLGTAISAAGVANFSPTGVDVQNVEVNDYLLVDTAASGNQEVVKVRWNQGTGAGNGATPYPGTSTPTFTAKFAHTHPANAPIYEEVAYSGIDPYDESSSGMIHTTGPVSGNLAGTRIPWNSGSGSTHNGVVNTLAQCTAVAAGNPATTVFFNPSVSFSPQPYTLSDPYNPVQATPTPGSTITVSGSVQEQGVQATPTAVLNYDNGVNSATIQTLSVTWTSASCGTHCQTWSFSGVTFASIGAADTPLIMYCIALSSCPSDSFNSSLSNTDWMGENFHSHGGRPNSGGSETLDSCSYQGALDMDNYIEANIMFDGNPSPASGGHPIFSEQMAEIGYTEGQKPIDIFNVNDPWYVQDGNELGHCTLSVAPKLTQDFIHQVHGAPPHDHTWNGTWQTHPTDGMQIGYEALATDGSGGRCPYGTANGCGLTDGPALNDDQRGIDGWGLIAGGYDGPTQFKSIAAVIDYDYNHAIVDTPNCETKAALSAPTATPPPTPAPDWNTALACVALREMFVNPYYAQITSGDVGQVNPGPNAKQDPILFSDDYVPLGVVSTAIPAVASPTPGPGADSAYFCSGTCTSSSTGIEPFLQDMGQTSWQGLTLPSHTATRWWIRFHANGLAMFCIPGTASGKCLAFSAFPSGHSTVYCLAPPVGVLDPVLNAPFDAIRQYTAYPSIPETISPPITPDNKPHAYVCVYGPNG